MRYFLITTIVFIFFQLDARGQEGLFPVDFYRLLNSSQNVLLLDVQTPEEYRKHRIPNHIYAGEKSILMKEVNKVDKNTKILVYCTKGKRSASVLNLLKEEGFTNVFHLEGGINKWIEEEFPVDSATVDIP